DALEQVAGLAHEVHDPPVTAQGLDLGARVDLLALGVELDHHPAPGVDDEPAGDAGDLVDDLALEGAEAEPAALVDDLGDALAVGLVSDEFVEAVEAQPPRH